MANNYYSSKQSSGLVIVLVLLWTTSIFLMIFEVQEDGKSLSSNSHRIAQQLLYVQSSINISRLTLLEEESEWKNILLRGSDATLYKVHLEQFNKRYNEVNVHLEEAKRATGIDQFAGDDEQLSQLITEHISIYARYQHALKLFNPGQPSTNLMVDYAARGIDDDLKNEMAALADHVNTQINAEAEKLESIPGALTQEHSRYIIWILFLQMGFVFVVGKIFYSTKKDHATGVRVAAVFEAVSDGIVVLDSTNKIDHLNFAAERMLKKRLEEIRGQDLSRLFMGEGQDLSESTKNLLTSLKENSRTHIDSKGPIIIEPEFGKKLYLEVSVDTVRNQEAPLGEVMVLHDVSERELLKIKADDEHQLFQALFDRADIGLVFCQPYTHTILLANLGMAHILGVEDSRDLHQRQLSEFIEPIAMSEVMEIDSLLLQEEFPEEISMRNSDGRIRWYSLTKKEVGSPQVANQMYFDVFLALDITDRIEAQQKLTHFAYYDSLTGLANRTLLKDEADRIMAISLKQNLSMAFLMIDLDHFKDINDTLGHMVGDELLRALGDRLKAVVRPGDVLGRLGGDEFILLMNDMDEVQTTLMADKVISTISDGYVINGRELYITASVGIALFPEHGMDYNTLLRRADMAMYHVKNDGRVGSYVFNESIETFKNEEFSMENDLRHAVAKNEFVLFFQPKVLLSNRKVIGAEALIRWSRPKCGMISPLEFIPLAERSDLINRIGAWVIEEACARVAELYTLGFDQITVSFNVSPRQLVQGDDFINVLKKNLEKYNINQGSLTMEITESALSNSAALAIAKAVQRMGVQLSLDDFGTGYSSLALLQKLPFAEIKIDRSFVNDFLNSPTDDALVRAVINIGEDLEMNVIAEGVETEYQVAGLMQNCCPMGQGYLFGRPVPFEQLVAMLRVNAMEVS